MPVNCLKWPFEGSETVFNHSKPTSEASEAHFNHLKPPSESSETHFDYLKTAFEASEGYFNHSNRSSEGSEVFFRYLESHCKSSAFSSWEGLNAPEAMYSSRLCLNWAAAGRRERSPCKSALHTSSLPLPTRAS